MRKFQFSVNYIYNSFLQCGGSKNEAETRKSADPEEPLHTEKSRTSVEAMEGEKAPSADKPKRFKWLKKKNKIETQTSGQAAADFPLRVEEDNTEDNSATAKTIEEHCETENSIEENRGTTKSTERQDDTTEAAISDGVDRNRKPGGPEPVREQTVRMITKIDYEPSAFGAYIDTSDPPEKDQVIQERYKGSFTEDSLKSTSTESTADRTPESISLRVEDYEEAIRCTTALPVEFSEKPEKPLDKEIQIGDAVIHGEAEADREENDLKQNRIADRTGCSSGTRRKSIGKIETIK